MGELKKRNKKLKIRGEMSTCLWIKSKINLSHWINEEKVIKIGRLSLRSKANWWINNLKC